MRKAGRASSSSCALSSRFGLPATAMWPSAWERPGRFRTRGLARATTVSRFLVSSTRNCVSLVAPLLICLFSHTALGTIYDIFMGNSIKHLMASFCCYPKAPIVLRLEIGHPFALSRSLRRGPSISNDDCTRLFSSTALYLIQVTPSFSHVPCCDLHVVNALHVRSGFFTPLELIIPVIWICQSFKCPRSCSYFVRRITFRFLSIRRLRCCVLCSSATLRHQGAATCPAGALAVVYKERLHLSELPCPRSHLAVAAHCYRRRLAQVSLFVSISFVDITDDGGVH